MTKPTASAHPATWNDFISAYQPGESRRATMDRFSAMWSGLTTDDEKRAFVLPCVAHADPGEREATFAAMLTFGDLAHELHGKHAVHEGSGS